MIMRSLKSLSLTAFVVLLVCAGLAVPVSAQVGAVSRANITITGLDLDVLYLADFLDVTTGKLKEFVPAFSAEAVPVPTGSSSRVTLELTTQMILQDDPTVYPLTYGNSLPFTFGPSSRTFYSRDLLVGGRSDVRMINAIRWDDNNPGKKKLEEHLKRFPSAPVGTYRFIVALNDAATGAQLGRAQYDLIVRNASPDEVIVALLDPQPGEVIHTTNPTFTWRADRECEVHIYERLPMQRSLQDAIAGVPHAIIKAGNAQTVSYALAGRRLEYGKTYVWFVRTIVRTNRGDETRDSELRSFRILPAGQSIDALREVLTADDGVISGTLATLESMGWELNGEITLDGKPISQDEAKALLRRLASQKVKIAVRVE